MKLTTSFDYPPIPVRSSDWSCIDSDTFDTDWNGERYVSDCPIGRGATEEEAVIDFVRQLCEDVDWPEDTEKEDRPENWDRYNAAHTLEDYLDF